MPDMRSEDAFEGSDMPGRGGALKWGLSMKGLVIHRYGGPDVMQLEERDPPAVRPRDVRIDVRAASLNPIAFLRSWGW